MTNTESLYCVMAWENGGMPDDPLTVARGICVKHLQGEAVTKQMVVDQFTREVAHYPAGLYRIYPLRGVVDVTVHATVTVES